MKQGDKVEVSDYSADVLNGYGYRFLMMNPIESEYKYVVYNDEGEITSWRHCEPIETPEYTIEEAIKLVGHEFKIKK